MQFNCKKAQVLYYSTDTTIAIGISENKSDHRRKNQGLIKISMFFLNLLGAQSISFVCIYTP